MLSDFGRLLGLNVQLEKENKKKLFFMDKIHYNHLIKQTKILFKKKLNAEVGGLNKRTTFSSIYSSPYYSVFYSWNSLYFSKNVCFITEAIQIRNLPLNWSEQEFKLQKSTFFVDQFGLR